MTPAKRVQIVSLKLVKEGSFLYNIRKLDSPEAAVQLFREFIGTPDREVAVLLCVDTRNQPMSVQTISVGSLSSSIMHPREILKLAVLQSAASIIVCHNHPSGDPEPSRDDREVTGRLNEACQILGIQLLDHIILGDDKRYVSLKERQLM